MVSEAEDLISLFRASRGGASWRAAVGIGNHGNLWWKQETGGLKSGNGTGEVYTTFFHNQREFFRARRFTRM